MKETTAKTFADLSQEDQTNWNALAELLAVKSKGICADNECTEDDHNCESYAYVRHDGKLLDVCASDYFQGDSAPHAAVGLPWSGSGAELWDEVGEQTWDGVEEMENQEAYEAMQSDLQSGECATINDKDEVFFCGKLLGKFPDRDEAFAAIREAMDAAKYWPNIYSVNDHGNVTLHDSQGNHIRDWV